MKKNKKISKSNQEIVSKALTQPNIFRESHSINWKFISISAVIAMILGFISHIFSINSNLVLNDSINLNYLLNSVSFEEASKHFLKDMILQPLTQPWVRFSFVGDFKDYGTNFMWYHGNQIFMHIWTVGAIYFFNIIYFIQLKNQERISINPYYLAFFSSTIFACHPLTSQTVAYLSARPSLLATNAFFLFFDLFLIAFLSKQNYLKYLGYFLAFIFFLFSIWSNPEMVSLPSILFLSLLLLLRPLKSWKESLSKHPIIFSFIIFFLIATPFLLLSGLRSINALNFYNSVLGPEAYLASQMKAISFYYLRSFIVPYGLSIDPAFTIANKFSDPFVIAALISSLALFYCLYKISKLKDAPLFGIALILVLGGFIPHLLIRQADTVADWVVYLPLSGLSIFAAYPLTKFIEAEKRKNCIKKSIIIFSIICSILIGLTIWQDYQWSSNFFICKQAEKFNSSSTLAHAKLAQIYLDQKEIRQAEQELEESLKTNTENFSILPILAQAKFFTETGNYTKGEEFYRKSLNLAEQYKLNKEIILSCKLGIYEALAMQNNKENFANDLLTELEKTYPGSPKITNTIGNLKYKKGDFTEAFLLLSQALRQDPTFSASWSAIAESALKLKEFEAALAAATKFKKEMDSYYARTLFIRTALAANREYEAIDSLKSMLNNFYTEINPSERAEALFILGKIYIRKSKIQDGDKLIKDAVEIDPTVSKRIKLSEYFL